MSGFCIFPAGAHISYTSKQPNGFRFGITYSCKRSKCNQSAEKQKGLFRAEGKGARLIRVSHVTNMIFSSLFPQTFSITSDSVPKQ